MHDERQFEMEVEKNDGKIKIKESIRAEKRKKNRLKKKKRIMQLYAIGSHDDIKRNVSLYSFSKCDTFEKLYQQN